MKIILITILKLILKFVYFFLKLFPTNNKKVTFISRQGNEINIDFKMIADELIKRDKNIKIVFICKRMESSLLSKLSFALITLKQMYHIATSKIVILDSYCIPISILNHKKSLYVLQIWHSIGKIKKSGYQTLDTPSGRSSKIAKAMNMHKNYDAIIAGGKAFNKFYCEGFNCNEDILLNYGLPRIDALIAASKSNDSKVLKKYPELKGKKIVYYAPTFRTYPVDGAEKLIEAYNPDDFALLMTCHPNQVLNVNTDKIYLLDLNEFSNIDILSICDYLIADFGSISIEGAVLKKKTLYYIYDYDEYTQKNGLNLDPTKSMPTCCFKKPEDLFKVINNDTYDTKALEKYIDNYLPKKLGQSTKLIVDHILKVLYKKGSD